MTLSLYIKGLKSIMHDINEYVLISIYISVVKKDDIKILYRIHKKIHFVDNLKAYMLLNNDIINPKKIVLNVVRNKVYINNCEVIVIITN